MSYYNINPIPRGIFWDAYSTGGGGVKLDPPSKIHRNAPISLKNGTKVHNYQNSKEKNMTHGKGGWVNFWLRGPIFGKFLAKFKKSLNFGQIIVEKYLTLEMKAFDNYFHIKEKWKSFF